MGKYWNGNGQAEGRRGEEGRKERRKDTQMGRESVECRSDGWVKEGKRERGHEVREIKGNG